MKHLPTHDGSKFDWSTGIGVAEASDFLGRKLTGFLYSGSLAEGFVVRSHRTGEEKVFSEVRNVTNRYGETVAWEYESIGDGPKFTIRIYND